jgi:anti-anti-sigma regulatory factor
MAATYPAPIVVDVGALAADALTIDVLAHLQLAAGRLGRRVQLCNASDELQELIAFAGLAEVLGGLGLEPGRQAEEREERLGGEEERELGDPAV